MRALLIGDVVGGVGLKALLARLPGLREAHRPDVVVVNAENAAAGAGTSPRQAHDLLEAGVDVITGGNHTLQKREIYPLLQSEPRLLRPANIAARAPGRGLVTVETAGGPVSVVNVMGSVFMTAAHSPFAVIDDLVDEARRGADVVLVDVHAEATSEKIALGWHLDGRVSAVVGTHTHVQTADARVLPKGTAYVSDLGMTGPHDSVIGVRTDLILQRFLTGSPGRFEPADENVLVQGAVVDIGGAGRATAIETFSVPGISRVLAVLFPAPAPAKPVRRSAGGPGQGPEARMAARKRRPAAPSRQSARYRAATARSAPWLSASGLRSIRPSGRPAMLGRGQQAASSAIRAVSRSTSSAMGTGSSATRSQ